MVAEKPELLKDANLFLSTLAVKMGKLLKGAEPDLETVARIVIQDWQKGRLPYFVPPPNCTKEDETDDAPLVSEETVTQETECDDTEAIESPQDEAQDKE